MHSVIMRIYESLPAELDETLQNLLSFIYLKSESLNSSNLPKSFDFIILLICGLKFIGQNEDALLVSSPEISKLHFG